MKKVLLRFFKNKWLQNGILVVISSLLTIICVDLYVFYALDWKYPGYGSSKFYQFSPLTGYVHTPNIAGRWYTYRGEPGWDIKTNRFGFTDDEHSFEKSKPRIALLGDSVIQAWEMDEADRPHKRISALLQDQYEILNFGIRGYGLDQSFIYFQHTGIRFSPDIVVLYLCINDIKDNANMYRKPYFTLDESTELGVRLENYPVVVVQQAETESANPAPWYDRADLYLYNRSLSYRELFGFIKQKFLHPLKNRFIKKQPPSVIPLEKYGDLRPYKAEYDQEDQRRMELTLKLVSIINNFLKEKDIRLLLVLGLDKQAQNELWRAKFKYRYGDVFDFSKVDRIMGKFARKNDIAFLSLPQELETANAHINDKMYPSDYLHYNAHGSAFFSQAVVDKLTSLQWVH